MRGRDILRILAVLALAVGFGIAESLFKGDYAGVRGGIGNLAAPWLVLPLACAALAAPGRLGRGGLIGLASTLAALTAFYLVNLFVLQLGPASSLHDIAQTLETNSVWFTAGVISGPVMGCLGAWAAPRGRFTLAAIGAAIVLFEPLIVYLYLPIGGVFAPGNSDWQAGYAIEAIVGVAAVAFLWRTRSRRHR